LGSKWKQSRAYGRMSEVIFEKWGEDENSLLFGVFDYVERVNGQSVALFKYRMQWLRYLN